jgi:hypothetical protein
MHNTPDDFALKGNGMDLEKFISLVGFLSYSLKRGLKTFRCSFFAKVAPYYLQ